MPAVFNQGLLFALENTKLTAYTNEVTAANSTAMK
jgi:hypothetical protein